MGESSDSVRVPWRNIALVTTLLAIGSTAVLVIIAAIKAVDTLSTIALSLAILAFLIQIIFFIAQTSASSAINSQTSSLLSEVRTKVEGISTAVGQQTERLWSAALRETVIQEKKTDTAEDSPTFRQRLERNVERLQAAPSQLQVSPTASSRLLEPSPEDRKRLRTLRSYPTRDEAIQSWEHLKGLSPLAMSLFQQFAVDEMESLQQGLLPGLPVTGGKTRLAEELKDGALLKLTEPEDPGDSRHWFELTDEGRQAARLLVGRGKVPDYFADLK